jgi:predicted MarR family transcription regulator
VCAVTSVNDTALATYSVERVRAGSLIQLDRLALQSLLHRFSERGGDAVVGAEVWRRVVDAVVAALAG